MNMIYSSYVANLIIQEANVTCFKQIIQKQSQNSNFSSCTYSNINRDLPECQHIPNTLSKCLFSKQYKKNSKDKSM